MDIKILETDKRIARIYFDFYLHRFLLGIESCCYCGDGEFFIHLGFFKIAIIVLTKTSKTDNPFDEML